MVLFNSTLCGGSYYPQDAGGVQSNPFSQNQTITSADWLFNIESIIIPFNFIIVNLTSEASVGDGKDAETTSFLGPTFLPDLSLVRWQKSPVSPPPYMNASGHRIASINFQSIRPWDFSVFEQCMGEPQYIGVFPLSRFNGQSQRCDTFMPTQWCVGANLQQYATECACIIEEPTIEAESKQLGVALPVICFGEGCATGFSYKTNNMLSKPCNITVCQQTISSTPGIVNEGTDTVFCGGQFYNSKGTLAQPSVTPIPPPSNAQQEGTPFYVWIMLGVSAVLFAVLIYLLFSEAPKKDTNVLRQIRKLQSKRSVPSTPVETVSSPNTGL